MPRKKESNATDKAASILHSAAFTEAEIRANEAEAQAGSWKAKYKDAVLLASTYKKQLNAIAGVTKTPTTIKFPIGKKKAGRGVSVIAPANDWHIDEIVLPEKVSGKNKFNLEIAEQRIKRYYSKIVRLIEWQNHLAPVSEIWHPWLGDLLSGHIHAELAETNSLSPVQACNFLQDMLCSGIDYLVDNTGLPIRIPTCCGNHGRTTERMRVKSAAENSFEWLLYSSIAKYYRGRGDVQFNIGTGYHNVQEIQGRRVRFHHGDSLRYFGGVGGISIPVNKAIAQWNKADAVDFDIFGHWHTHMPMYPYWISCGCLIGYSEFAVKIKADFQHPTQLFCVIDRRYGITHAEPIFVTKAKEKKG